MCSHLQLEAVTTSSKPWSLSVSDSKRTVHTHTHSWGGSECRSPIGFLAPSMSMEDRVLEGGERRELEPSATQGPAYISEKQGDCKGWAEEELE